jgi:oxygen-independent coproporphyrinogen-3 oxidase
MERLFVTIRQNFEIMPGAEITVECAPATLTDSMLSTLCGCGVNRVSLGMQSFVDAEARAVGRMHTRAVVLEDIARLGAAGIANINLDLIAGLPHQTAASWQFSLEQAIACGVPHVSVYMLEVDEDSRLGRELIAGGTRYHARSVPDEELIADLYLAACEQLNAAGIHQYEISNFARAASESRHNLKYWTRHPYLGCGVDAHSLLKLDASEPDALRIAFPDSLEQYNAGLAPAVSPVSRKRALEESFFLGLRLNHGIELERIETEFGPLDPTTPEVIAGLLAAGLLEADGRRVKLTLRGRLLSNEVFEKFVGLPAGLAPSS